MLLCLLAACQFKFRGIETVPLSLSPIVLSSNHVSPDWKPLLKQRLEEAGVSVVDEPIDARFSLIIQQEDIQRNIMSVSSGSSSRQYQLIYKVLFSFEKIKGKVYLSDAPILVTRALTINNDRILGSNDEEEKIIHEIRRDAATQIIYRLSTLSHHIQLKKNH